MKVEIVIDIVEVVDYDLIGIFFNIMTTVLMFIHHWAPIIILLFIARVVWLIYKLEKRKFEEKDMS